MDIQIKQCVVCGRDVEVSVDFPDDEDVLCIQDYFTEDITEEWETDE